MASSAPLGDRNVPKPANQGGMKTTPPRPPRKAGNMQGSGSGGKEASRSIKAPGSGTRGQMGNRAGNSVKRAS